MSPLYNPPPAGGGSGAPTTSQYVTLALDGTLSAERVLAVGNLLSLTDAGANGNVTLDRINSVEQFDYQDEFVGSSSESGEIGELGWILSGSFVSEAASSNHPGIVGLRTAATTGSVSAINLGITSSQAVIIATEVDRFVAIVKTDNSTNVEYRIGLLQSAGSTDGGTAGAFFEFDSATSANWLTKTRQASTTTSNTSSVAVTAANWYQLEMRRLTGGNWEFYINNSLAFTHSTNLPTVGLVPTFAVETKENATKDLMVDYFRLRSIDFGQRWT